MKKEYTTPVVEVISMDASLLLAGSIDVTKDSGEYEGVFNAPQFGVEDEEIFMQNDDSQ